MGRRKDDTGRHRPFPEAVLPGTWIVKESGGLGATGYDTATGKSRMFVPMRERDAGSRSVRIHEQLHVRFSRWTDFDCDRGSVPSTMERAFRNIFEDLRIERLGQLADIRLDIPQMLVNEDGRTLKKYLEGMKKQAEETWPVWQTVGYGTLFVPFRDAGAYDEFYEAERVATAALDKAGYDTHKVWGIMVNLAEQIVRRPHWETVAKAVERACEIFEKEEERKEKRESGKTGDGEGPDEGPTSEEEKAEDRMEEMEAEHPEDGEEMSLDEADDDGPARTDTHAVFGPMKVVNHDLVHPHGKGLILDKRDRPAQYGTVPKYMHRWSIDMAVFRRRMRRPGRAVVLVDTSGSMHIPREQLEDIMRAAPGSTIALYHFEGTGEGCNERAKSGFGCLHVVADGGKRIAGEIPNGSLNVIDGTALDWLVKQKALHRIWVSDGLVTGWPKKGGGRRGSEIFAKNLHRECMDKVKQHGLRHVLNVEDALGLLSKLYISRQTPAARTAAKKSWKTA